MSERDPATMSTDERRGELARILALGFLRLSLASRNGLALSPDGEPSSAVYAAEKATPHGASIPPSAQHSQEVAA